jgi:uncharacterized membrane protein YeaQ/YmgE (transglycosylase-associated protein family)
MNMNLLDVLTLIVKLISKLEYINLMSVMEPIQTVHFVLLGLLGAIIYVLVWAKSWDDLKKFESIRHLILGPIIGYIYSILVNNYSYPDLIMTVVAGYFGVDFIEALVERFKK